MPQEVKPLYILNFHFCFKGNFFFSLHISAFSKNTTHALAHFESFLRLPTVPTKNLQIWSLGVLLWVMVFGENPFENVVAAEECHLTFPNGEAAVSEVLDQSQKCHSFFGT